MEAAKNASNDLLTVLNHTQELIDRLFEYSNEKEACLRASDTEGLREVIQNEEKIIADIGGSEKKRKVSAGALAEAAGFSGEPLRLKDLIDALDDPDEKKNLHDARNKMIASIQKLSAQNARFKDILKYKMNYTEFMLNLLYEPKNVGNTYNIRGDIRDGGDGVSLLDYHA